MSAEAGLPGDERLAERSDASAPRQPVADLTKEYVMSCLPQLVVDGIAQWETLDNGDIELRFKSGGSYLLGDEVITRTA